MATREQRKASKKKAKRSERSAARRRGAALKRAAAQELADIRRNTHVEKGRAVSMNDIRPYARQKCEACRLHPGLAKVVKDAAGKVIGAEPCACAHRRFMKAHPEVIVEAGGQAWWPAGQDQFAKPATAGTPPDLSKAQGEAPYSVVDAGGDPIAQRETRPPEPGETDPAGGDSA